MSDNIKQMIVEIGDLVSPDNMSEQEEKAALLKIEEVLRIDHKNTDALLWKAIIYEIKNDYAAAVEIYEEILKITPNDKQIKESIKSCKEYMVFDAKREQRKFERAQNYYNRLDNLLDKFSIWQILLFKAVLVLVVLVYILS